MALALVPSLFLPVWKITPNAPQYPGELSAASLVSWAAIALCLGFRSFGTADVRGRRAGR